ncbi:MAG: ABC transporter permease [Oscillospiraceae bacterium]|nr:ABC transporter permease [Oscillospiraceae bacterium]MBR2806712.1 ABC transporter permease [Oscillospiraceae bacterium]
MWENVKLAFRGIKTHKMRSFLTMLGVIIGIAAIIAIVSTIQGTNEQIKQNLVGSGTNTVDVRLYQGDSVAEFDWQGIPDGVPPVSEETLAEIVALPNVEAAARYNMRSWSSSIFHQNHSLDGGHLYGIDLDYLQAAGKVVVKGRGFISSDYSFHRKVVLLDDTAVTTLFEDVDPIGRTIEIGNEPFVVVGIIKQVSQFEPVINSLQDYYMYAHEEYGEVYIPLSCWPILYKFDEPQSVLVKVSSTDAMTSVGKDTADILNRYVSTQDSTIKYQAEDLLKQAENLQQLSASTNRMLIWIAAISLLVGGIGVMNIMLVSVTERTREIGLKKALGAKKSNILVQFLTEAAVLTSMGGVIGIIVGIGLAYAISSIAQTPVAISGPAIIIAVGFSIAVGLIFGLLPSINAANLNPIDALRSE